MSCPKRNTSGKNVGQSVAFFRGPALGPTCHLCEALRLLEQRRCDKLGTFLTFVASILPRLFYGQTLCSCRVFCTAGQVVLTGQAFWGVSMTAP